MENTHEPHDKENSERRNSNTEYLPTKCRITKPPPPKPATNPLQFIKVNPPSSLYKKAQEQIKKVEETKVARQEIRDEAEDWQANLDNWKSSRRKLQEHIIERVVEVKKLTQEDNERSRRRNKTFSEMIEDRSRGRHKFNIPVYDDDSNDLSDYGIGSSSSKANSVKDVDTDDSISILDEKEHTYDLSNKSRDTSGTSNQSQSEDETSPKSLENNNFINSGQRSMDYKYSSSERDSYSSSIYSNFSSKPYISRSSSASFDSKLMSSYDSKEDTTEKYTYEGAIQDYRTRIKSRINLDESFFNKPQDSTKNKDITTEVQSLLPKGNLFKRKEIFESDKSTDSNQNETSTTRRFSEDFANAQSIKERLKSLEKCVDQPIVSTDKNGTQIGTVKSRLQSFDKSNEKDVKNNNVNTKNKDNVSNMNGKKSIGNYLIQESKSNYNLENSKNEWKKDIASDRSSSPETELYMDKLNMMNQDFDNLMYGGRLPRSSESNLENFVRSPHYTASSSSTELMAMSSDREDSGIHTADVSCSVSQADEPFDDADISSNTIPHCIEKLNQETEKEQNSLHASEKEPLQSSYQSSLIEEKCDEENCPYSSNMNSMSKEETTLTRSVLSKECVINVTQEFIGDAKNDSAQNSFYSYRSLNIPKVESIKDANKQKEEIVEEVNDIQPVVLESNKPDNRIYENVILLSEKPVYENVVIRSNKPEFPQEFNSGDILAPPKMIEPPKVKPPPPPPLETSDDLEPTEMKRLNSTKRIKKEIQIKRSSFLGLEESVNLIDPELNIEKPPDVDLFLKQESKLEKSFYKKLQGSREGGLSEVDSQDSGLEVDRGRLSSDTWCSSYIDSGTPILHARQDSEQTNSYTSEEEEIMKKEREIIEMVEKEEKSRDVPYPRPTYKKNNSYISQNKHFIPDNSYETTLGSDEFNRPFVPPHPNCIETLDDRDSEVLKVEHELLQLEREELERQQENMLFRENQLRKQNRYSLENICSPNNNSYAPYNDYRKSMPELQHISPDLRKSMPDVPGYRLPPPTNIPLYHHTKSMPDIQNAYRNSMSEYRNVLPENNLMKLEHQKSMPDLDHDIQPPVFRPPPPVNRQPIMPGKPIRPYPKDQRDKMMMPEGIQQQNIKRRPISAHNLHSLSAAPKSRPIANDNWIQPKAKPETKSYNQHWLYQEAELRRLSDKNKNWNANRGNSEKHIPDAVIQSLTQRVHNRAILNDRSQHIRDVRSDGSPSKDMGPHPYLNHPQTMGHALPMACPPHVENQDKMLSVSGKKKCSYCNNELGRGAAMIIESLCLFYHMECFKCCVCHMQLGDGLMGTDVRVRNQKLHCHNCYSSDDGVKFSCV